MGRTVAKEKLSSIRNKQRRQAAYAELRRAERHKRVQTRRQLLKEQAQPGAPPRPTPKPAHTLESLRRPDDTIPDAEDIEVAAEEGADEFNAILCGQRQPCVVVTNGERACGRTRSFLSAAGCRSGKTRKLCAPAASFAQSTHSQSRGPGRDSSGGGERRPEASEWAAGVSFTCRSHGALPAEQRQAAAGTQMHERRWPGRSRTRFCAH